MKRLIWLLVRAASRALSVPIIAIRMVLTGFFSTVSTPAMEAMCTTASQPSIAFVSASLSITSPLMTVRFSLERFAPSSAFRRKLS
jgi:hypothetical protein